MSADGDASRVPGPLDAVDGAGGTAALKRKPPSAQTTERHGLVRATRGDGLATPSLIERCERVYVAISDDSGGGLNGRLPSQPQKEEALVQR